MFCMNRPHVPSLAYSVNIICLIVIHFQLFEEPRQLCAIDFIYKSSIFYSTQIRAIVSKCTQGSMHLWSPRQQLHAAQYFQFMF